MEGLLSGGGGKQAVQFATAAEIKGSESHVSNPQVPTLSLYSQHPRVKMSVSLNPSSNLGFKSEYQVARPAPRC